MRLLIVAAMLMVAATAGAPSLTSAKMLDGAGKGEVLATASLETDRKRTSGTATVLRKADGLYLSLGSDFRTGSGPDVFVLLHKQGEPRSYADGQFVNLGMLSSFRGEALFKLPDGVDPADYASVVIWCRQFNVTFGSGPLRPGASG